MTNISYLRAGASCLPLIGPFVGLYNTIETENEIKLSSDRKIDPVCKMRLNLAGIKMERGQNPKQELQTEKNELINTFMPKFQKGRLYASCAIIGNVLSVATIVGLVALNILSGVLVPITLSLFSSNAIIACSFLFQHTKNSNALQNWSIQV